jgi:hypothetical protein
MKSFFVVFLFLVNSISWAKTLKIRMKLSEVNSDSTQARFFKGQANYGLADAFGLVSCQDEGSYLILEMGNMKNEFYAHFNSQKDCKKLIKLAQGPLGLSYGEIEFIIDSDLKKILSTERVNK